MLRDLRMDNPLFQPAAISILAFSLGYTTHLLTSSYTQRKSLSTSSSSKRQRIPSDTHQKSNRSDSSEISDASDAESDMEDEAEALRSDIANLKANLTEEVKLVLVVNDSLKMSKGKIAAQAGHATLACAMMLKEVNPKLFNRWRMHGQPKIAVRCQSTEEIDALASQARSLHLCARTIQDAGRTQVAAGSKTILGIGPGPARLINQVTGKLKLL